ncbi:RNA polymerase Rpb4, partial [Candidatus Bathyarchaeota archaeon]|nr:RNA polymerase Rpb4 [Candidatus Bathyarchaeota archaeon]NIW34983.1 RNA polymerase Rpb4 [Candidatus Bathyarchaeota archaeon]
MPRKAIKERPVTIPEVKKILESIGEEHLDQFQRRSLDYATKFSKTDSDVSEELVKKLIEDFDLE